MDLSGPVTMKSAAKCDMSCDMYFPWIIQILNAMHLMRYLFIKRVRSIEKLEDKGTDENGPKGPDFKRGLW